MEEVPGRERSPPGAATPGSAARVLQPLLLPLLLLLLLLLGGQGQGGTPGRCDCASESQKRYGPFCCRGCPKGHYMKTPCTEPCGDSFCLPCSQGSFLTRDGHFKTECTRCQVCDEEGEGLAARGSGQAREDRPSLWIFRQLSWMRGLSVQSTTPGWGVPFFPLWPSCLPGPPPLVHHEQLTSTLLSRLARGLSQGGCPLLLCSSQ